MGRGEYRTNDMLSSKWRDMNLKVRKFNGIYSQKWQTRRSGQSDAMIELEAEDQYRKEFNAPFSLQRKVDETESDAASGHVFDDIHCLLLSAVSRHDRLMPWRKAEYDAASGVFECSTIFTACYCLLSLTLVARQNNNVRPMLTPEAVLVIRNGRPELYFTFSHINKIFELGVSENLQELANYFSVDNIEKEMRADIFIPNDTRIIDLDSYAFFVSSEELVASVCDTLKSVKDVPHILKVSSLELAFLPYLSRDKLLPQEVYLNQTDEFGEGTLTEGSLWRRV
ncbi:hypothetical protein E3N88_21853 [Mikania micrantha]|uniref:Uncharacterized protein n=1 Tax=Mikania micrantha TaxID=192012 RepID=A0A5N6N8Q5_9ASTR|nr:hypothetical protein E3N88_21853 [Mikania micrantha]